MSTADSRIPQEYPPLEEDKEFRCLKPECKVVSCRSCRQETHVPKTCEEAGLERGHSARHAIEEAMTAALVRKCNKCATSFIKENGCNKVSAGIVSSYPDTRVANGRQMTCPKCRNLQCYICSKTCEYSHFNDPARGGKAGQCPLFDEQGIDVRHAEDVRKAEEEARTKIIAQNADIDRSFLEIRLSDRVKQDEEQRLKKSEFGLDAGR